MQLGLDDLVDLLQVLAATLLAGIGGNMMLLCLVLAKRNRTVSNLLWRVEQAQAKACFSLVK